jgi:hypothetical protein
MDFKNLMQLKVCIEKEIIGKLYLTDLRLKVFREKQKLLRFQNHKHIIPTAKFAWSITKILMNMWQVLDIA